MKTTPAFVPFVVGLLWRRRQSVLGLVALVPLLLFVYVFAFWLRFEGNVDGASWEVLAATAPWLILVKIPVFAAHRVHLGNSRYITFHDLVVLARTVTIGSVLFSVFDFVFLPALTIPRSVFLMDWGLTLLAVGGVLSLGRFIEEPLRYSLSGRQARPVLIVGVNRSGEALLRSVRRHPEQNYRVVGFVAENQGSVGSVVAGVKVVGHLEEIGPLVEKCRVEEVLITSGELSGKQVRALVEQGEEAGVVVKVVPSYEQLLDGNVLLQPRSVSIEDLLRRDPVQLHQHELENWLSGKTLLVTGCAGSIGSEICRQLLPFAPAKLVLVDRSENGLFFLQRELAALAGKSNLEICVADVADSVRIENIFIRHRPEIVFHAAAYKHVPLMEANPGEAVKNIPLATRELADLARHNGVESFVMISTDKAVNPTSVMGACKRAAELYVQSLDSSGGCRFVTVRFGNVLDSAGSVVPIFREQIAKGGPVSVTHPDMIRYFMTIPEASQLVIQAGAMGKGGEIFVLDMGDPVKIVDLARDMIHLSGLREGDDIEIEFVGIRPGEKLYEELHAHGEHHIATSHPKIMVAESRSANHLQVKSALLELESLANGPESLIIARLSQLIPEATLAGAKAARIAA